MFLEASATEDNTGLRKSIFPEAAATIDNTGLRRSLFAEETHDEPQSRKNSADEIYITSYSPIIEKYPFLEQQ